MLEGNLQLLEAVCCLVISEPKTNMTGNFTDLRTDGRWQLLQDIGHMLRSYDTSAGTCIEYGKTSCASHSMYHLAGKTFGFTGGHPRLSMELHRTPEGLVRLPLGWQTMFISPVTPFILLTPQITIFPHPKL